MGGLGVWETSGYASFSAAFVNYSSMTELRPSDRKADDQFLEAFGVVAGKNYRIARKCTDEIYYLRRLGGDLPFRKLDNTLHPTVWLEETDNYFATMVEMMLKVQTFPLAKQLNQKFRQAKTQICEPLLDVRNWPTRLRYRARWQDVMQWVMGKTQLAYPDSLFVNCRYDTTKLKTSLAYAEKWYTSARHMRKGDLWVATVYLHRVMSATSSWLHSL